MNDIVTTVARACDDVMGMYFVDGPPRIVPIDEVGEVFPCEGRAVLVGVSGDWRGLLVLLYRAEGVARLAEAFIGMPIDEGMQDYVDEALIEIGNQVTARTACAVSEAGLGLLDITPPSLMVADAGLSLTWNRLKTPVLAIGTDPVLLNVAIGLSPGPSRRC